jgi:hypothetical protein
VCILVGFFYLRGLMIKNLINTVPNSYLGMVKISGQKTDAAKKDWQKQQNNVLPCYFGFKCAQALKAQIFFKGDLEREYETIQVAKKALAEITKLESGKNPDSSNWYENLKSAMVKGDATDFIKTFKDRPKELKEPFTFLKNTLRAMIGATEYEPIIKDGIFVPINNPTVAENLKPYYSSSDFNKLFVLCDDKKVFNLKIDAETGLPQIADINPDEDKNMCDNKWVTDTCRNIDIMKDKNPKECTKALKTLAKYYKQQENIFNLIINDRNNYGHYKNGLGHVFKISKDPKTSALTLETDHNYSITRLESTGLYLNTVCDAIKEGLKEGKDWGFQSAEDVNQDTIDSVVNIVKYLKALDYPYAPSCGNWEEGTFDSGLTSDTEIINNGLRNLRKLLYSDKYKDNEAILNVRKKIIEGLGGTANKEMLDKLIARGEERVKNNHLEEAPGLRKADASLAFVTHTAILDENPIKNVEENLEILDLLDKELVGIYGIRRYNGDRYENLNSNVALNWFGEITGDRCDTDTHEAQWFMVSDMAKGYGVQLKKLLNLAENKKNKGETLSDTEKDLIKKTYQKETEYINRSYARITGNCVKANGRDCSEFALPESYMAVSTLYLTNPYNRGLNDRMKKRTYLPGTNTPLAWAQSSLYDASKLFKQNLEIMEKLNKQGIIKLKDLEENTNNPEKTKCLKNAIVS